MHDDTHQNNTHKIDIYFIYFSEIVNSSRVKRPENMTIGKIGRLRIQQAGHKEKDWLSKLSVDF
jgi:hypothetical protein